MELKYKVSLGLPMEAFMVTVATLIVMDKWSREGTEQWPERC